MSIRPFGLILDVSCIFHLSFSFWKFSKYLFFSLFFFFFFFFTQTKDILGKLLFLNFIYLFLFLAVLGLHCCTQAFSSCSEGGLLFIAVRRFLIAVASLVAEHGLQAHGLQQLWHAGSVVAAHGLSCSVACGIFPDQGSNPCPLHWQADS